MSSTYGQMIKLSIFGQSHGPAIGMTLDGVPAGLPVDEARLAQFLTRRAPGRSAMFTTRKEPDRAEFLSGIVDGHTCGAPISAIIRNTNTRSGDYGELLDCPRPGHADYTAQVKYGGAQDAAGGGHFSGRLTAPLCIAGGLCKQWLDALGIDITAHIYALAGIRDLPFSPTDPQISQVGVDFPVLSPESEIMMRRAVEDAKMQADSVGGIVECAVTGLPVGLGEPMFGVWRVGSPKSCMAFPPSREWSSGLDFTPLNCAEARTTTPMKFLPKASGLPPITPAASSAGSPMGCL